jgi:secreted trypsin-like serine protease
MNKVLMAIFILSLAGMLGCGDTDEINTENLETVTQAIYGGIEAPSPTYEAVVALMQISGKTIYFTCSGTLIRDQWVLTAGHCLKGKKASSLRVYFGADYDDPSMVLTVSSLKVHPNFNSKTLANDVGLLKLSAPVTGITPIAEAYTGIGLTVGEPLDFAGYGRTETGYNGLRLHAIGDLDGFGCDAACGCPTVYQPSLPNSQVCYDQGTNGPCFGDSGGPAFVLRNEKMYVAATTSYGDKYCTIYGVSTRTDAFESFIHLYAGAD